MNGPHRIGDGAGRRRRLGRSGSPIASMSAQRTRAAWALFGRYGTRVMAEGRASPTGDARETRGCGRGYGIIDVPLRSGTRASPTGDVRATRGSGRGHGINDVRTTLSDRVWATPNCQCADTSWLQARGDACPEPIRDAPLRSNR
jgi:hypothetical protein